MNTQTNKQASATEKMICNYASRLLNNLENNNHQFRDVEDLFDFYLVNAQDFPEPMEYEFFKNNFDDILLLAVNRLDKVKKLKNDTKFQNS